MLSVAFVDRTGSGLWEAVSVLYFSDVAGLSLGQIGTLVAVSGAVGIAGAPIGGRIADRLPLTRVLIGLQVVRALAAFALLTTDHFALLLLFASIGSFGDRSANVLTKLYAARIAGPGRVRYQAVSRTVANAGWAVGGLAAAGALAIGSASAYAWLLAGNALSFLGSALITALCAEPTAPSRTIAKSGDPAVAPRAATPWRDRRYLAFVVTETVLFLDDAVFKVGLPLWTVHATDAPHGLVPLLMVINNVMVVGLQVPLARFGTTTPAARRLLLPLSAIFALAGVAIAASTAHGAGPATAFLVTATAAFTLAEIIHATVSWELSIALAPDDAQGAYLGVHGLAQSVQRSIGPLAVTAAIATGPAGWLTFGAVIAGTCLAQHRLVRPRPAPTALSVAAVTVSEH
ncbi:MFS transporter [Streptomyces sp. NBC_00083]|uniref:MFS transporter n=1 Tax=Streptomyces sp. NBC_00083 TaxID=2975647 RepID=UPI002257382F|nr:MFS transporter [Streptomyces sp. NBC_00083]MCX5383672.1 MFS transporter [Streptomyces sp. NBC_00083]